VRRLLAYPTWALLVALVGVSAALRDWAAGSIPTPWINPDELIYGDLGRSLWQTGHLTLFGLPTGFFSFVYPAFAGLPLSLGDRQTGYALLQGLQAVLMSLAAVPVYLWARRLATREWALVAAAFALVPPGLAYSGLIMTEVAFYPAFVLAAWPVWNALAAPSPRSQALALAAIVLLCAVRLQGFVVALAYLTAIAVEPRRLRVHLPVVGGFAALAVLWAGWQLRNGGPLAKVLGAYEAAGETHYRAGAVARFVLYHVGDVVLICGIVPVLALVLLAPVRERGVRTYVIVTLSLTAWLVLQVGVFASRHIGYTAERNLFALVPVLGIGLVVWLARAAPRPRALFATAGAACVLLLVTFPFESFSSLAAAPSNFTLVPLYEVNGSMNLDLVVPLGGAAVVLLAFFRPTAALAALVVLGGVASVATSRFIVQQARGVERLTLGQDKQFIQQQARASVAFLYSDDLNWETVWETSFWNPRVRTFYDLLDAKVPGPIPQPSIGPYEDGRLVFRDGSQAPAEYALASKTIELFGVRLGGTPYYTLWRVEQPFRIRRRVIGLDTSSTAPGGRVEFDVYACSAGTLHGTLVSKQPRTVQILRNGAAFESVRLEPNVGQPIAVPAAVPEPAGQRVCRFSLRAEGPFSAQGLTYA